jgi:hypothetical protein
VVTLESLRDGRLEGELPNVLESFLNLGENLAQGVLAIVDADSLEKKKTQFLA